MEKKQVKNIAILAGIAVVVFGVIFGVISLTQNAGKSKAVVSTEKAMETLGRICNNISITDVPPTKANVDLGSDEDSVTLPDISKYPPQAENTTPDFVEIFSSTEKAGTGTDGWLVEMANEFNAAGVQVGGKPVSVRVRGIASGDATQYIASKAYTPDAFSPSNELWGEMLKEKGIQVTLVEKRLSGNVTGVLFSKEKNQELITKYGAINLKNIAEAVKNNEIAMGYTNPFASSSGLNFLVSTLYTFDAKNPLSETAVSEFESFQQNIPFVAYTTLQMRDSAKSGALDGFILEYQSYQNMPDIKADYVFTPYGVRHDSPVYEIGALSADKKEILKKFIDFCKSETSQKKATTDGFNGLNDYKLEQGEFSGSVIVQAQKLWKEKKDAATPIAAVFVADISGSMEGEPMNKLKESLVKGAKYIGKDNSVGLVSFSNDVNINLPIGKFDLNQRSLFTGAVQNLQPGGATAMFDGIAVATQMLLAEKEKNPNTKLMLFVLTDGETNRGHSLKDIQGVLESFKVPIYTIGYNANLQVLETISGINEAASINADTDDVVYKLENLFNAQM